LRGDGFTVVARRRSRRGKLDEAISQFIDFSKNKIAALTATLRSRLTAHRNDKQISFAST